jgi:hypothetical protein
MAVKTRIRTARRNVNIAEMTQNISFKTRNAGQKWTTACLCVSIYDNLRVTGEESRSKGQWCEILLSEMLDCAVGLRDPDISYAHGAFIFYDSTPLKQIAVWRYEISASVKPPTLRQIPHDQNPQCWSIITFDGNLIWVLRVCKSNRNVGIYLLNYIWSHSRTVSFWQPLLSGLQTLRYVG